MLKVNLVGKTFAFGNVWNLLGKIVLESDGKIGCYNGTNEHHWDFKNNELLFFDSRGNITTKFKKSRVDNWWYGDWISRFGAKKNHHWLKEFKPWSGVRRKINDTTLVCVDCLNIDGAIRALKISQSYCDFDCVKFLTSADVDDCVKIPEIKSIDEYSFFCLRELYKYIDTRYALIVQHDGFVLNPDNWDDKWYGFDFIGANINRICFRGLPSDHPYFDGGNGGFSFRSKALMDYVGINGGMNDMDRHEDASICVKMGLELYDSGFKFSNDPKFSENGAWYGSAFGYHGKGANLKLWE
jgi:hypothetical protein